MKRMIVSTALLSLGLLVYCAAQAEKSDEEIITSLYLAALCRNPASEEMAASKRHIAGTADHKQALEDVGWAILNSKEFLFQH